jgi:hypothetical protein
MAIGAMALSKRNIFEVMESVSNLGPGASIASFASSSIFLPVVFIVCGILVALLSFFGCCGAIRESTRYLAIYCFSVFVLIVGIVVALYFAGSKREEFLMEAKNAYTLIFNGRNLDKLNAKALDELHKFVSKNPHQKSPIINQKKKSIPAEMLWQKQLHRLPPKWHTNPIILLQSLFLHPGKCLWPGLSPRSRHFDQKIL